MAIATPTVLTTLTASGSAASRTTASVSPSANALIVVCTSVLNGATTDMNLTISSTLATGAWTRVEEEETMSTWSGQCGVYYAIATATPGSGTITITETGPTGSASRWIIHVFEIASGFDTTTPVLQNAKNKSATNTIATTLSATPRSGSLVLMNAAHFGSGSDNGTPPAGYTELAEAVTSTGSSSASSAVAYLNGSAGTGATYTTLNSSVNTNNLAVTVEIQEPVAGGANHNNLLTMGVG